MLELSIVFHINRYCIMGLDNIDDDDTFYSEVFKQAIDQGFVSQEREYYIGTGRWFSPLMVSISGLSKCGRIGMGGKTRENGYTHRWKYAT